MLSIFRFIQQYRQGPLLRGVYPFLRVLIPVRPFIRQALLSHPALRTGCPLTGYHTPWARSQWATNLPKIL